VACANKQWTLKAYNIIKPESSGYVKCECCFVCLTKNSSFFSTECLNLDVCVCQSKAQKWMLKVATNFQTKEQEFCPPNTGRWVTKKFFFYISMTYLVGISPLRLFVI